MNPLIIEATELSPKIVFDPIKNIFEISGESRPENAEKFYQPVIAWMEGFLKEVAPHASLMKKIALNLRLEYYNTASSKMLLNFFSVLKEMKQKNVPLDLYWHYDKHDVDMQESGEEFSRLLAIPITMVPSKN